MLLCSRYDEMAKASGFRSLGFIVAAAVISLAPALRAAGDGAVPVRVVAVGAAGPVRTLTATGTVTVERRARLSPRVSGLVAQRLVSEGDVVDQGDVLVELDAVLAKLAERRARAAVVEAKARLAEARRLRDEAATLLKDEFIPESEVLARESSVQLNAASVARLEADASRAREIVARHSVLAPFAGVVSRQFTEVGEWVETGNAVLEVVGVDQLRLDVQVPQERFGDVVEGAEVEVRLAGSKSEVYRGRVAAKVPVHDPVARTFLVRIALDEGQAMPGMSGEARFGQVSDSEGIFVPRDAVVRTPNGADRVWVVETGADGPSVVSRDVRIGRALAESVEVVDGLESGATVVVRGNETLADGQLVRLVQ